MLNPSVDYVGTKARVNFNGDCFKQAKISFVPRKIANVYTFYERKRNISISSYPTLDISLFGVVKSKKHADINMYKYSGYGIGFNRKGVFSIWD